MLVIFSVTYTCGVAVIHPYMDQFSRLTVYMQVENLLCHVVSVYRQFYTFCTMGYYI